MDKALFIGFQLSNKEIERESLKAREIQEFLVPTSIYDVMIS